MGHSLQRDLCVFIQSHIARAPANWRQVLRTASQAVLTNDGHAAWSLSRKGQAVCTTYNAWRTQA